MEAKELRIGNYLNGKQGHVTVTEIRKNNIVKIQDNTSIFYVGTCLEPIPLTEEWLLNCGFKKHDKFHSHRTEFSKNKFSLMYIEWEDDEADFSLYKTPSGDLTYYAHGQIPKLKSVHELQNLYFALTGEELTFKSE